MLDRALRHCYMLGIWYARSMVCVWDGAGGGGSILRILTKIWYLLDTFWADSTLLGQQNVVDGASE